MSKNILITGVSRGLGLEIARAVLAAGWNVYGVSRTESPAWQALQAEQPERVHFLPLDLGEPETAAAAIFEQLLPPGTPLHGIVNNAAVAYDDLVTNLDAGRLRAMYEVNVFAPMVLTKFAIRRMLVEQTRGSLVHVSSVSAHTGYKGLAMYASTKGALEAFSLGTAREWGARGIRSNCVAAGFMATEMSAKLTDEQRQRIFNRAALKQPTGLESVAATVVHLLGDGAASITGEVVRVDGGTI